MSYVLGSLGGDGLGAAPTTPPMEVAAVLQATGIAFDPILRPVVKAQLVANMAVADDNQKIFNAVRFNDANISRADANARASKANYVQPYKAYRDALRGALDKIQRGSASTNALRYHLFELIDSERVSLRNAGLLQPPAGGGGGGGKADTKSVEDNTMIYVGVALGLVALVGLSRRARG